MRALGVIPGIVASILAISVAHAADEFVPETLTVEKSIKPGTNLLVLDQNWKGPSRINVLSADDLSSKGIFSSGVVSQLTLSKDRKTAYTTSAYPKRIMYGPTEAVLQEFDVATLTPKREIVVSNKMAQVAPYTSQLRLTADEHYALVQNATPATSITVVDLRAGKPIAEIPTPGCWGIYPAPQGEKFATLCGDGTAATFEFKASGEFSTPLRSEKFFDTDSDPVYVHAERVGDDLLFTSFNGNVYRLSDAGPTLKLKDKFSVSAGVPGEWAPGGFEITAYNAAHNMLFLAMHPDAEEGSHKEPAKEVWAFDLKSKKLLSRSPMESSIAIAVTGGDKPLLFGMSEDGTVTRYEIDPQAKFAAKLAGKVEKVGEFTLMGLTSE